MRLGVCYYPEHWPEQQWPDDAKRMFDLGIRVVRIGEFAWSRLEPSRGDLQFDWLQRSLDILHKSGLQVVLGTPTATPPKWLVDSLPGMLALDEQGQARGFGSRRHYCFSSTAYRAECKRIVRLLAERFGEHPAIVAWQTDNEYGCHETILSYSIAAQTGFQAWCQQRYGDITSLNKAWGNVFWSMEYGSFEEIDLPVATVTEANPAHRLAFWRYSSDQVQSFNQDQTTILRELGGNVDLVHNYMGNFVEFDHYAVANDLDVASWDSYPLGFLDRDGSDPEELRKWYRSGHPDTAAFHHDLYRGVGKGRWWVMEQQPGPVNWAPHNPAPLAGMVRLWTWEAFAHGAELVAYFRWRQMPQAQEQNHSGLCLPDGQTDTAFAEVKMVSEELALLTDLTTSQTDKAPVALVFDYHGDQMQRILRMGGEQHDPLHYTQEIYRACRLCGVNIDIVPASADLSDYRLILLCNQPIENDALCKRLAKLSATIVLFPGTGSRNDECAFPTTLGIGAFRKLIDIQITRSETTPASIELLASSTEQQFRTHHWRERVQTDLTATAYYEDGWGFHYARNNVHYLNAKLVAEDLNQFIRQRLIDAGVAIQICANGLRLRSIGDYTFAFNYGPEPVTLSEEHRYGASALLLGKQTLAAGELALWKRQAEK